MWYFDIVGICESAPKFDSLSWKPTALFNGMFSPCLHYTIRGIVWYQGESNDKKPISYYTCLDKMITLWQKNYGDILVVVVQLPGCDIDIALQADAWPTIRMAQQQVEGKNIAVTVNIDIGEYNDLHPVDKKIVAGRIYEAIQYLEGKKKDYAGPRIDEIQCKDGEIILSFTNCYGNLTRGNHMQLNDNPKLFHEWCNICEITEKSCELQVGDGISKYWYPNFRLKENKIYIETESKNVREIRYGWCNFPYRGLLFDERGTTVRPFVIQIEDSYK